MEGALSAVDRRRLVFGGKRMRLVAVLSAGSWASPGANRGRQEYALPHIKELVMKAKVVETCRRDNGAGVREVHHGR